MLANFLDNIQKYLFFWITGAVVLGLVQVKFFGGYSFTPLICLLAALIMIYPSLIPLPFEKLKEALKKYKIISISILLNFILAPTIAFIIGYFFLSDEPVLWLGLILLSLLPGGGMVTTWVLKSRADMPLAVGIIFFNLMAAILISPFVLSFALAELSGSILVSSGSQLCALREVSSGAVSCGLGSGAVTPIKIIPPVFFIIIVPLTLAWLTQRIIKVKKGDEYFEKNKKIFGDFGNLGLIIILFILTSLKNNIILFSETRLILKSLLALILFYFINLAAVLVLYKKIFKTTEGKSLVWGSYLRYITLALGLAVSLIYGNADLAGIIVIVVLSYFVQIPISFWLAGYFKNN